MERGRVGDNHPHLFSEAQSPQGGPFPFQIFDGIVELHFVRLQKSIKLVARLESQ